MEHLIFWRSLPTSSAKHKTMSLSCYVSALERRSGLCLGWHTPLCGRWSSYVEQFANKPSLYVRFFADFCWKTKDILKFELPQEDSLVCAVEMDALLLLLPFEENCPGRTPGNLFGGIFRPDLSRENVRWKRGRNVPIPCVIISLYVQRLWFVPPWLTHRHTDIQLGLIPSITCWTTIFAVFRMDSH